MSIIKKAENYLFGLFKDKLSPSFIYHNFNHTLRVVNSVKLLAEKSDVNDEDRDVLLLAAWFHDSGYTEGCKDHEEKSCLIAEKFLKENNYPEDKIARITQLIMVTKLAAKPDNLLEYIIRDADCSHFAEKNYSKLAELLREEWRLTLDKEFTDVEWATANRDILMYKHRFYTD